MWLFSSGIRVYSWQGVFSGGSCAAIVQMDISLYKHDNKPFRVAAEVT